MMRENWSSRRAFILAAIGSAIGLGNIWRFPFKCYENGGGAFLIAYIIAMLTAGVPLLILELSLGHRFKLAAPLSFRKIGKKFEWVGWWAVFVGFVIVSYYAVVMAWGLNYSVFSFTQAWGENTKEFFFHDFLGLTSGPFHLGGIRVPILISLIVGWILIVGAVWKGAKTVSKVVYVTVFLPWLLLLVFVVRGVTLPGSLEGIKYYLQPHFHQLLNPSVWITAYGQIFYSLSIGFGIMIAYASFLPKDAEIINSSIIITLSNCSTSFIGGFAVFGSLGYYAHISGQAVQNVLKGGPGLAFITYPTIINHLPFARLFGIIFFLMLLTLAIDSAFSLLEAVSASMRDKFGWGIKRANITVTLMGLLIGLIFTTGAGLFWLDIVDKWIEFFGLSAVVLTEAIVLGWFFKIDKLRLYANDYSEIKIGKLWNYLIKFAIPVVIFVLILSETIKLIVNGYENYPNGALLIAGWGVVIALPILALVFSKIGKDKKIESSEVTIPKIPFTDDTGFKRFNRYLYSLLVLGILLAVYIVLSFRIASLKPLISVFVAIYIFLALVGGAIYFTVISIKNSDERETWSKQAFPENEK
ncbi:MAG: sodium-dependent transporter [Candidatus Cloacimonadota bacterium]|nr:MAG: sodium-dependent transporter [Candidatus Cloacimonadota bacterium]